MSPEIIMEDTMSIVVNVLRYVGVWYPEKSSKISYFFYFVYSHVCILLFLTIHNITQIINLFFIYDDLEQVAQILFILAIKIISNIKAYIYLYNNAYIQLVVKNLNNEIFKPKNNDQEQIMNTSLDLWKKVSKIYFGGSWFTTALMAFNFFFFSRPSRTLVVSAWYPYDYSKSPLYEFTGIYQIICILYICAINASMDILPVGVLNHIGVQCDFLCNNLKNLSKITCTNEDNQDDFLTSVNSELYKCIKHHREILRYTEMVEKYLNFFAIYQLMCSVLIICMAMLHLSMLPLGTEFVSIISFQICATIEIFLYCWYGNEVIIKSSKIADAAFECGWINYSIPIKKKLMFFIKRTQKPIKIRVLDFFPLSVGTFTGIIRSSYSYYAVLRQRHQMND